jgi:cytochrome c
MVWIALLLVCSFTAGASQRGEDDFSEHCSECHSPPALHKNKLGPNLAAVLGRAAGTVEGFQYSDAMKKSGITWTRDKLDNYLTNPQSVVPGNRMSELGFMGVSEPSERAEIIDFLSRSQ